MLPGSERLELPVVDLVGGDLQPDDAGKIALPVLETTRVVAHGLSFANGIALSGEAETNGLGAMSDDRWSEFFAIMSEQKIYPSDLRYRDAYTLQFVNKGYALNAQHAAAQ